MMLGFLPHVLTLLAATSTDDGGGGAFGLIFLLSGFVFYGYVFLRYRNVGKRHHHETETEANKLNLTRSDEKIQSLTGLHNSRMSGANNTAVGGAGGLPFSMGQLKGLTSQLGSFMEQAQTSAGSGEGPGTAPTSPSPTSPPPTSPPPTSPPPHSAPTSPPPQSPPPQGGGQSGGSSF